MSHDHASLLIELGTEELPPKALDELAGAFAGGVVDGLARRGIAFDAAQAKTFCSPRRLAVLVPGVAARQPPQKSEVLGPYLNIGLDANGAPTPALTGFAAKNGVAIDELQRASDAKGERFVARSEKPGQPTAALLPEILVEALKALPVPKPMRWGDRDFAFVRPAHWLVVLHGDQVVECEALGLASGRMSRGHRFHHPHPVHKSSKARPSCRLRRPTTSATRSWWPRGSSASVRWTKVPPILKWLRPSSPWPKPQRSACASWRRLMALQAFAA